MVMETVDINLGERSYHVLIGTDWLARIGASLRPLIKHERIVVVSDRRVAELYANVLLEGLCAAGYLADLFIIPDGETAKTLDTVSHIYDFLIRDNYSRESTLVALGGGVVGDITGFAAATYMRGIQYVQVPTTLLAMVDSSVGGKTGVNHPLAKNIIGAFHQPRLVCIDTRVLKTLDRREFRAGFAEVIKCGVICDEELFAYLEGNLQGIFGLEPEHLNRVVKTCCAIKGRVVEEDEREAGLRAILNFGHTIGHALEALTNYNVYKHGEAIAIGMVAACRIAVRMGMFSEAEAGRVTELVLKANLPHRIAKLEAEDILEKLKKDKKVRDSKVRFVLPEKIGRVVIRDDVSRAVIQDVLNEMRE
jgi:3-dehydroquinate synthase